MQKVPVLTVIETLPEGETTARYVLGKPKITIGRSPDCDVRLRCQFISRHHARLEISPERVVSLFDHSRNGIDIFDRRMAESAQLASGDRIHFSDNAVGFYSLEEADESAALVPLPKPLRDL